jgi:hypothetical protein
MDREAGKRLRGYIRERMARADIATQDDLWRAAGIGRDTGQAWLRGERRPTPAAGAKLAAVFGETYFDLLRAVEGDGSDLDDQTLIAAFEWAIEQVRARSSAPSAPPPEVSEAVAAAEDEARRQRGTQSRPPRSPRSHNAG